MVDPRFVMPGPGEPAGVRFPAITRDRLANGLRVWTVRHAALPLAAVSLLVEAGSADDPVDRPGLASITADLLDERAGGRDAIGVADAWARLGAALETDTGSDVTAFGVVALARLFDPTLALLAEVVTRADFTDDDLARVRDLRLSRLRQMRTSASTTADRAFLRAIFGEHGYGHGSVGTMTSVQAVTRDDVVRFHARAYASSRATLIVSGDIAHADVMAAADRHFGGWRDSGDAVILGSRVLPPPLSKLWLIDRPGATQSELRIGHLGAPRAIPDYHALATLNGVLGGQFSSRLNQRLRQDKGYTYGAHSSFDTRQVSGTFVCDTSVQSDATTAAIRDVIDECVAIRTTRPPAGDELARVKDGLTRGYGRNFETATQLGRAAAQLAVYGLPDDTFDRFVPTVLAVTDADALAAARSHIRPDELTVVVVGDATAAKPHLGELGMTVEEIQGDF